MNLCPWTLSIFSRGMTSVVPKRVSVTSKASITKIFKSPKIRLSSFQKKNLPCWSPALYAPNKKRSNSNVTAVSSLVYDFDNATEAPAKVIKRLDSLDACYAFHTTWSHRPNSPRYRIILFLSEPLTPVQYPIAWENGLRFIGYDAGVDRQARDISRHYALPSVQKGEEYVSEVNLEGRLISTKSIAAGAAKKSEQKDSGPALLYTTVLELEDGKKFSVRDLIENGAEKYKCRCPFQDDASGGSAFFRVLKDGRAFIRCTSERHDHAGKQFWLQKATAKKADRFASRSVDERIKHVSELTEYSVDYCENRLSYNTLQGVFYRHAEGAWQISQSMRKEHVIDHLMGLLPKGYNKAHANAVVDHILSRQVYGFDCKPTKDHFVYQNEVPKLNLYAWPDLKPKVNDWPRIQEILEVLTDNDKAAYEWMIHWSAALVQNPTRRSMVAVLVLSTQQGVGKSLYGRLLAEIIGKGNTAVVSNRALRDNFNSHYVTSLLVLADEVGMERNSSDVLAEIKAAITDDRIHCSTPYAARTTIVNRMSWYMTSNKRRPFSIEQGDRRFTVLLPGKASKEYRKMLRACFDAKTSQHAPDFYKELQGFAHSLKQVAVDWDLISHPYTNEIKTELQVASMGSADAFVEVLKRRGPVDMISSYPPPPGYLKLNDARLNGLVPCETLYGSYREWCGREGRNGIYSEPIFRLSVKALDKVAIKKGRMPGKGMKEFYVGLKNPSAQGEKKAEVLQFPS